MNKNFLMKMFCFAALLLCCAAFFCSCGSNDDNTSTPEPTSADADYTVNIVDAIGNPITEGVVVKFMQDGNQISMHVVNENGQVVKNMLRGDYSVELLFTAGDSLYYYDKSNTKLTAGKTSLEIMVSNKVSDESQTLVIGSDSYIAYFASVGGTYSTLVPNQRNYFIFRPTVEGLYKFYIKNGEGNIGYYGAPHYVQSSNAAEIKDENSFSLNIYKSMISTNGSGTTEVVIGIDPANNTTECILRIERLGEPEFSYENEPWTIYNKTVELNKYALPQGATLNTFDLTSTSDTYNLVLNEDDGFYHIGSKDGPLVLVNLTEDSEYLASFKNILDRSGVVKYFFNENDEYVKKESYSECLLEYIESADSEHGVYPLTADLKYIIQQRGDYVGWFDESRDLYLFKDTNGIHIPGINNEISWLFMCCYITE